jgi:hemoglobin
MILVCAAGESIARVRGTNNAERRKSMRMKAVLVALALAIAALPASAATTAAVTKSLFDRLGGKDAITAVVEDFVGNVAADKRINAFFAKADIPHLKAQLVDQICEGTGGPCKYTGKDMKTAHAGMGVGGKDFDALVQDLGKSLKKFKVPKKEQKELVAILAPLKKDIVEKK